MRQTVRAQRSPSHRRNFAFFRRGWHPLWAVDIQARLRSLSDFAAPWVAAVVPGFAALSRLAVDSVWRDDLSTIRGLGLVALGGPTTLTMVGMQLASLLPLGPLPFRLAILSASALSVCAWLIFTLARRLFEAHVPKSFLNAPLAAIAALAATLGPGLQGEGTVAGGATIPLAAGLGTLLAYTHPSWSKPRRHLLASIGLGALLSENLVAAAVVAVALLVAMLMNRDWPKSRRGLIPLGACGLTATALMLPALLRPASPHPSLNFGRSFLVFDLAAIDTVAESTTGLAAWRAASRHRVALPRCPRHPRGCGPRQDPLVGCPLRGAARRRRPVPSHNRCRAHHGLVHPPARVRCHSCGGERRNRCPDGGHHTDGYGSADGQSPPLSSSCSST